MSVDPLPTAIRGSKATFKAGRRAIDVKEGVGIEWFSIAKDLGLEDGGDEWKRLGKRCGIYVLENHYVISSGLCSSQYQQT